MLPAVIAWIVAVLGTPDDWSGVQFRLPQFEQAIKSAQDRWLDVPVAGSAREQMAWRKSAEQALWSLEPTAELVPDAALASLRGPADRHGHYAGEPIALPCDGKPLNGLKIFRIAADVEKLEDEDSKEVRVARSKQRADAIDAAWEARFAKEPFGKAELRCAMDWLAKQVPAAKLGEQQAGLDLAWINAASGWLKAIDHNGDVIALKFWERVSESDHVAEVADPGIVVVPCPKDAALWCVGDVRVDGPAWQADVRVNDQVVAIDAAPIAGKDHDTVAKMLNGAPGSSLKLALVAVTTGKARDLKLARDQAVEHDVQARELAPGVLHVRLRDFVHGTANRFRQVIAAALLPKKGKKPQPLRGIVLDMRGHPGGILDEAIAVADALLSKGAIVHTQWRTKTVDRDAAATADDIAVPLVILVDKRCASACEVLTGALQDNHRGPVLGGKTYGKALMQEVKKPNLMADFYVKATIGRYLTPAKRDLDRVGTQPDVALPADATLTFAATAQPWPPLAKCVGAKGQAPQRLAADLAPKRKPDAWLEMARDWLDCAMAAAP